MAELPLVADHQQTVVTSTTDKSDIDTAERNASRAESPDPVTALFSTDGSDVVPGSVLLEHFEIQRRIGSGGMGRVFLAEDTTLRRPVALKVLNPVSAAEPALLARFQNEARSAALLRHDNIAQVYFTGESRGVHFIACEYIVGRTLRELIETHQNLPPDVVLNYAVQATLALNHMYAFGVVHRDIKPSNIIVSDEGRVKIVDLGLARRDSPDSVCDITVAGSTLGTFDYLAPEQARDPRQADVRSDIYSLGCTLYHMLTGQPPYPEGTALQKLLDHQGKQAPDPARINNQVPAEIADIVLTMMSTDPADRYQVPGELLTELIEVATDIGLQGVPADGVIWQKLEAPPSRRLSGVMILLAAVVVFCATALTLHSMPGDPEDDNVPPVARESLLTAPGPPVIPPDIVPPIQNERPTNPEDHDPSVTIPTDGLMPFVVHFANRTQTGYATLRKAMSELQDGAVIELTFNGTQPVPIRQLPKKHHETVQLYATEGVHPILEFHGSRDESQNTSIFDLSNCSLSLDGIGLRLVLDGEGTDTAWSVFNCSGSTHLDLRRCSIDIVNPDMAAVEICRLKESTSEKVSRQTTDINLTDVIVRGTADMFHLESQTDGFIHLDNCGFGLDGHLLNNTGGTSMDDPGTLELVLHHVTCIASEPLFRIFENEFSPTRRMISNLIVNSRASVFCSTVENGILVDSEGTGLLDELSELVQWNGDTNLYDRIETLWKLKVPNSDGDYRSFRLIDWNLHWKRTLGLEPREVAFDWQNEQFDSGTYDADGFSVLNGLQPDWFRIDGTQELPMYLEREVPGVVLRRLPHFPESPMNSDDIPLPAETSDAE
ncbi:MAG: serine/threonine protein kinase [Fuerstiella sp.]|nr:serine/threonine protein kinase [Fuerstiella sp.]